MGIYFHDPLPSDVRRKNDIPLFQTRLPSKSTFQVFLLGQKSSFSHLILKTEWLFLLPSLLYKSGPDQARGSHFLLGCRLSKLALSRFQSIDFQAVFFASKHAQK